jgi:hypothetical protein
LRTISCSSSTKCVAIGPNPAGLNDPTVAAIAVQTSDAGTTWTKLGLPANTATLDQVTCVGVTSCVAGGLSPTATGSAPFYESTDGGSTWTPSPSPPKDLWAIAGISCEAPNHCALVGRLTSRAAATASSSDLSTWSETTVPSQSIPPPTNATQ